MSSAGTNLWRRAARTSIVCALIASSAVVGFSTPAQAKAEPTVINLLTLNDFHGRINSTTVDFAKTIEKLRQDSLISNNGVDNTLLVGAGDLIGASEFASDVQQDQPTIEVMNALGLDASSVGNHEFDKGWDDLTQRVIDGGNNASWDYLGANVYTAGTTTPALQPYGIYTVNGIDIGVIGVVTQETPTLVSPAGISNLTFGDPVEAINRFADQLTDKDAGNGEADIVIATMHEGAPTGTDGGGTLENQIAASPVFASLVNDVSPKVAALVQAHTHQAYVWDGPVPGEPGKTRPIIQTGNYAANVGQIRLSVDADTNTVTSYAAANVARQSDVVFQLDEPESIPLVASIVNDAIAYAASIGNEPIGKVSADITTAFAGGSYVGGVYTASSIVDGIPQGRDNRAAESSLGNLVADALLSSMADETRGGADIALVNPGGLRAELFYAQQAVLQEGDGEVTYAEANGVLPFVNNLNTADVTGAQLVAVLEEQWQTVYDENDVLQVATRPYLQMGMSENMSYTYDPDPDGDGILVGDLDDQGLHINSVTINYQPIDLAAIYRLGTFSFLFEGGDNFRTLLDATDKRDSGLIDRDAWIQYVSDNSPLSPSFDKHAVAMANIQVNGLPVDDLSTVTAGDTVSLDVSNLNMTSLGAPENTTVNGSLVSTLPGLRAAPIALDLGAFPVVQGATTITFTVPAEAEGRNYLRLQNEVSGLSFLLPIEVIAQAPPSTSVSTPPSSTPTSSSLSSAPTSSSSESVAPTSTRTSALPTLSSTGLAAGMVPATSWLAVSMILVGAAFLLVGRRRLGGRRH